MDRVSRVGTSPSGFNGFWMGFTTPLPWTERQVNTSCCLMPTVAIDARNADDAVELAKMHGARVKSS